MSPNSNVNAPSESEAGHSPSPEPLRRGDPCTVVIFGASGDLTKRKLIPALYNLAREGALPEQLAIVGVARRELGNEGFREKVRAEVKAAAGAAFDPNAWSFLEERLYYASGDVSVPESFAALKAKLKELEDKHRTEGNTLFYLATAPEHFGPTVRHLESNGLVEESNGKGWRRVIVEKPFGHDLASAKELNAELRKVLKESQIYRIDHYLGKETVQNLLVLRFSNGIFEPIWNRRYVDNVQITVAETLGVEGRGGYYDQAGALRDMVPNHIFQLISLVAMEPPISFDADAVRDEQTKALRAITPMSPEDVLHNAVRGQYTRGQVAGREIPGYREEANVDPKSNVETFVAMKLEIDSWRWKGVPFYLRVGKALPKRTSEITVTFRRPPFSLFRNTPIEKLEPNQLVINVQPTESIVLNFGAKVPGARMNIGPVGMRFCYAEHFGQAPATGYERLLYDAVVGDQTLFQRADTVECGWGVVAPVLDVWHALHARDFPNYKPGTWGPKAADDLLARDGRSWKKI